MPYMWNYFNYDPLYNSYIEPKYCWNVRGKLNILGSSFVQPFTFVATCKDRMWAKQSSSKNMLPFNRLRL